MKEYKVIKRLVLPLAIVLLNYTVSIAQESKEDKKAKKKNEIATLINEKNFVFEAQTALPTAGRQINLTSPYDLRVSGDSVISYLPYFGRAYVAPVNPDDAGIKFTSTANSYNLKDKKNSGWILLFYQKIPKM